MDNGIEENDKRQKSLSGYSMQEWSLWQLLDSILPTGGFAHSFGLEAAIQTRVVNSVEDLQTFVIHVLENTGRLLFPFVSATCISQDLESWHRLDRMLNAMLSNKVARKASTTQGSALLRIAAAMFTELPTLKALNRNHYKLRVFNSTTRPSLGLYVVS